MVFLLIGLIISWSTDPLIEIYIEDLYFKSERGKGKRKGRKLWLERREIEEEKESNIISSKLCL